MRYSRLFTKTRREPPAEEVSKSAQLLIQAGFVQKEIAGVYAYLPLGKRVLDKIIQVIREEMEAIGGQEVLLGSLQNPETWETTNRWSDETIDVWFKTQLKNETELGLAPTHEEPLTKLMTQYIQSYKDLPAYIFQFQNKFRNELRTKSGIMRTREFIMKDLYSFNKTEKALDVFYEKAKQTYFNIFERVGIGDETYLTFASGGAFSKYSHEFQTICEAGEDIIYLDEEKGLAVNQEVYTDEVLTELGLVRERLKEVPATEVGNIFKLKTKYSEPLGLFYTDKKGDQKPVIMGCYGIGPGRLMGTIVELFNDKDGIIWPESIAPFKIHLISLNPEDEKIAKQAEKLYQNLKESGVETLYDDRQDVSAGEKFATADLIGIPYRLVVSKRNGKKVEVKKRAEKETTLWEPEKFLEEIK